MKRAPVLYALLLSFLVAGCEDTDMRLATEAGIEAVTAVMLTDETVKRLAAETAVQADQDHTVAAPDDPYAVRLARLVGAHLQRDGYRFSFRVYLDDTVNAFALADGTIRVYSGLLDLLEDGEVRFVIGHEMGHVVKDHVRQKMQMAYGASALRKGLASQSSTLGELARSQLGGFFELLLGAQFSQLEEKVADDYGLAFLREEGYDPLAAATALERLATLGSDHTFLSSHPDPDKRAVRIRDQLAGKAVPIEEVPAGLLDRIGSFFRDHFPALADWLERLSGLFNKR